MKRTTEMHRDNSKPSYQVPLESENAIRAEVVGHLAERLLLTQEVPGSNLVIRNMYLLLAFEKMKIKKRGRGMDQSGK